jgi:hypothetical protein
VREVRSLATAESVGHGSHTPLRSEEEPVKAGYRASSSPTSDDF